MIATQIKKLSVATVYGKIKLADLIEKKKIAVMIVVGTAIATKEGESGYGVWRALQGQFRAINPETGDTFEGPQLFLPDVALVPIEVALAGSRGVEFAIRVVAIYVADNPGRKPGGAPYEYTFEPLLIPVEDNPLDRLMAKIDPAKLALSGPALSGSAKGAKK